MKPGQMFFTKPTMNPVGNPIMNPVGNPTMNPVGNPTMNPVGYPIMNPVGNPTMNPVGNPIMNPVGNPTMNPVGYPTMNPVGNPIMNPAPNPIANPAPNPQPQTKTHNMSIKFFVNDETEIQVQGNSDMTIEQLIKNFKVKLCDPNIKIKKYLIHPSNVELDPYSIETVSSKGINENTIIAARSQ